MTVGHEAAAAELVGGSLLEPSLATFWRQKTPGGAYWRCDVPAKHLPGNVADLDFRGLEEFEPGKFRLKAQRAETAIWQFSGNATRGLLMAEQQEHGIRVLMEVDDNYLEAAPFMQDWQVAAAIGGDSEEGDRHSLAAHRRICEWVDGIIVATDHLARVYRDVNPNVYVCANSLDTDDWPEPAERDPNVLRIGWAASPSHHVDAPLVRRAMEWAVRQPKVEVYLLGYQPNWSGPFKRVPWTDTLHEYRRTLAGLGLDVGICPLLHTPWAAGKSDVKALEYAVCGAMPVMSRVEPYRPWFDVPWKLLVDTRSDWERALRWCVFHRDAVRGLAERAREYVLGNRTIEQTIESWRDAVTERKDAP